jgi:UDP-N-acetylmuramoyl-tripeptide--D-alanyl-D-alanine ligase
MLELRLKDIASAIRADGDFDSSLSVKGICTDTRKLTQGDIFIALHGENGDGHQYLQKAIESGAVAAIVDHPDPNAKIPMLVVSDTLKALSDLASYYRSLFNSPFVGVTGSVGKTSTREMIVCALQAKYSVLTNEKNYNNEIGVPQTLFRLSNESQCAVIEMGMRGKGQIRALSEIVRPQIGIITNIGLSHIELLGSRDAIASSKAELITTLPEDGFIVLNANDDYCEMLARGAKCHVITYGIDKRTDFFATNIQFDSDGHPEFQINGHPVRLRATGVHHIINATAACAVASTLGVSIESAIEQLKGFHPLSMRMEPIQLKNHVTLLNDYYNAAPDSMRSALETLAIISQGRRRTVAILGDMKELGEFSLASHRFIGEMAVHNRIDALICVGNEAKEIGLIYEKRLGPNRVRYFSDSNEAADNINDLIRQGDVALIKGSRAMQMEIIANGLISKWGAEETSAPVQF